MSKHAVEVQWKRESEDFTLESYNREHDITFGGGVRLRASAAPEYRGDEACPNPEEALVFALASCHMLTFLAVAATRKLTVERYEDSAEGVLEKNQEGKLSITHVTLRPRVTWSGEPPSAEKLTTLHEAAHRGCFIANSVRTQVTVEPR